MDISSEGCHICWDINTLKQRNKFRLIKAEEKSQDMKTRTKGISKFATQYRGLQFF